LKATIDDIAKVLETVYDPLATPATNSSSSLSEEAAPADVEEGASKSFAKVNGVAPGRPAVEAACNGRTL